jgi:FecR protein
MNYLLVFAFVMLQFVVSIKPGFVGIADGKTNVRKYEQLNAGSTVQTGPQSHVEIALGVDVFLRLDENSAAVLESIDSADVSVRLESGTALLEVGNLDKPNIIRITAGDMRTRIDSKGVFRFSENSVSVIDGKLKIDGGPLTLQKGWKATNAGGDARQSRLALNTPEAFRAFLNSPRAGFVNAVQGKANLHASEMARSDRPIQTEVSSYV